MRFPFQTCSCCLVLSLALLVGAPAQAKPGDTFELPATDGQSYRLPDDQQGLGIYLFWASWCPYCRALMPHLQSLIDQHPEQVRVYALQFRDEKDPAEYIAEHGFDFTVFEAADEVATAWGMRATPGLVIVDAGGAVRFNLYELMADTPPGFDKLNHTEKAARRAPWWAARIRERVGELLARP